MREVWMGMLAVGCATTAVAQQAQQPAPRQYEVTLKEAIERSLDVQPAMIQALGDQRNAGASKRSAYGAFIPAVTLGSSAARANTGRIDQITGRPVPAVPDTTMPAMPDTAELRRLTIAEFPAVEQAEAQATAARAQIWSARSQYWPTVTVSYSNNRQGTETLNGPPNFPFFGNYPETFQWRFALSWPILNGFIREANQVTASVNRDMAEARAADARRQANAQLTQQMAVLATAFEQISIADDNIAAAREDLRVQNERYRVGAATILDLLTSQAALTQAEVNGIQTRFNYLIARSTLEATVGRTL